MAWAETAITAASTLTGVMLGLGFQGRQAKKTRNLEDRKAVYAEVLAALDTYAHAFVRGDEQAWGAHGLQPSLTARVRLLAPPDISRATGMTLMPLEPAAGQPGKENEAERIKRFQLFQERYLALINQMHKDINQ